MTADEIATSKERAELWAKEHGEEFYRSIYPHGIPKELLESFGIFIEVKPDNLTNPG